MISCNKQGIHYHIIEINHGTSEPYSWGFFIDGEKFTHFSDLEKMRKQGTPEGMDCIFQFTPEGLSKFWQAIIEFD